MIYIFGSLVNLMIIIVTGTPGTGKTEIAKALAKEIKFNYLDVNLLIKEKGLNKRYLKKWDTYEVDIKKLNKILIEVIKKNKIQAQVLAHPNTKVTSLDGHLGLYGGTPDQVMKCLCMTSKGKPLVVIASGEIKIDIKKLSEFSGLKDIKMAILT